jgi:hypothetical protein
MIEKLYNIRFELFFFSQLAVLFGSLIFPELFFEEILSPILFIINLIAGIILLYKKKVLMGFCLLLLLINTVIFGADLFKNPQSIVYSFTKMISYFLFYIIVTYEIIKQVWLSKTVNKNVIIGLISGYVSLGLIGFFICVSIELSSPGSFNFVDLNELKSSNSMVDDIMYFSYMTLITIGFGDIYPLTALAKKAAILIGLLGQFYLVIITAIVVGKYLNQLEQSRKDTT